MADRLQIVSGVLQSRQPTLRVFDSSEKFVVAVLVRGDGRVAEPADPVLAGRVERRPVFGR
jgi:hypothetical protein